MCYNHIIVVMIKCTCIVRTHVLLLCVSSSIQFCRNQMLSLSAEYWEFWRSNWQRHFPWFIFISKLLSLASCSLQGCEEEYFHSNKCKRAILLFLRLRRCAGKCCTSSLENSNSLLSFLFYICQFTIYIWHCISLKVEEFIVGKYRCRNETKNIEASS